MTGDFNVAALGNPVYDQLLALSLKDTWTRPRSAASSTRPSTVTVRSSRTATASTGSSPRPA
jgi:hypothetical protein